MSIIWSETVIDGHPIDGQALSLNQAFIPVTTDAKWIAEHVNQLRYTLQIVKCKNETCCEPFVTNWLVVFPDCFVPFLAIHNYESMGQLQCNHQSASKTRRKKRICQAQQKPSVKENPNCSRRTHGSTIQLVLPFNARKVVQRHMSRL